MSGDMTTAATPPERHHSDPLAHPDLDRHPTHGPLGAVYVAVYPAGFFLLAPVCAIALIGSAINRLTPSGADPAVSCGGTTDRGRGGLRMRRPPARTMLVAATEPLGGASNAQAV
jgi:hypothetical protein